jgi:hypothetical protein
MIYILLVAFIMFSLMFEIAMATHV